MRNLTYTAVIISVLLSTGGVGLQSAANSTAQLPAAEASPLSVNLETGTVGSEADAKACRPTPPEQRVRKISLPELGDGKAILLNTRGYNYARPGEAVPEILKLQQPPAAPADSAHE